MNLKNNIVLFLFVSFSFFVKSQDLISADSLLFHINDTNIIIVDARSKKDFINDVHIKNAINIPYDTLQQNIPVDGIIKTSKDMSCLLGRLGVSNSKTIIVYDEGSNKYSSRLYWMLKYLGTPNVNILNGNLKVWLKKTYPITKDDAVLKRTVFNYNVDSSILATFDDLKNRDIIIIDARSKKEYKGSDRESKGHIPNAYNIEYKDVVSSSGAFKSKKELSKIFKNIDKNKTVIIYCKTSVRGSVIFFALYSILNYPKVKLYDGAYNEWVYLKNKIDR